MLLFELLSCPFSISARCALYGNVMIPSFYHENPWGTLGHLHLPTSLVCLSMTCIGLPMLRISQRATAVSDEPVASRNSLNGLNARQLMFAE